MAFVVYVQIFGVVFFSPAFEGIKPCNTEESPEKLSHLSSVMSSANKRSLSSSKKLNFSAGEQEDDVVSSCSEKLNIMSDFDDDPLDSLLEEKSKKVQHVHLTAKNVRSIIHVSICSTSANISHFVIVNIRLLKKGLSYLIPGRFY